MGDEAESIFEQVATAEGWGWTRYGLNRPSMSLAHVPLMVRYTPDYLTEGCFMEVQGCGHDQVIKVKTEKLECLHRWDSISWGDYGVHLFLWDRINRAWTTCRIGDLNKNNADTAGFFHEGKPWLGWNVASFPDWIPLESSDI